MHRLLAPYETGRPPYAAVSDFEGPYAAMPPEAGPVPRYGPMLLPPQEVYAVSARTGFRRSEFRSSAASSTRLP